MYIKYIKYYMYLKIEFKLWKRQLLKQGQDKALNQWT